MIHNIFFHLIVFFLFIIETSYATSYQEQLLKELMLAEPGTIIEIPEGVHEITQQLSLTVDDVTIRGKGMEKSILSFKNQNHGAEGFLITGNRITLEDFSIQDTIGDAFKIYRSDGLIIRGVGAQWTHGPSMNNGGYGFYPVQSRNIIIEGCVASGASDAGIYVGQSYNVIVRRNIVQLNVAGIEIENSQQVDVHDNYVKDNTGGILIFDLPDLSMSGMKTRVFSNVVVSNNTKNFSHPSNIVADVPSGTGIMVTANKQVEIFNNLIGYNNTTNILLVSYGITGRPISQKNYNPYVESIYILDNTMLGSGKVPNGGQSELVQLIIENIKNVIGVPFPDIMYDGSKNPENQNEDGSTPHSLKICIMNNHSDTFVNLDLNNNMEHLSFEKSDHLCELNRLEPVKISL